MDSAVLRKRSSALARRTLSALHAVTSHVAKHFAHDATDPAVGTVSPHAPLVSLRMPRVEAFRWVGGVYFLLLGMTFLLLPQGPLGPLLHVVWLYGSGLMLTGLLLLWSTVVDLPRRAAIVLHALAAVPLILIIASYVHLGIVSGTVTLSLFTLGVLLVPFAPRHEARGEWRPDVLGFVVGGAAAGQGIEILLGRGTPITIADHFGLSPAVLGIALLGTGLAIVALQVVPRGAVPLRWAVHVVCGGVLLSIGVAAALINPVYWVLNAAGFLRIGATVSLPWLSEHAVEFDRRSHMLRPRLALALITASLLPPLIALPIVLGALDQQVTSLATARQAAFGVVLFVGIGAGIGGWWLAGRLVAPITNLADRVERIAAGERPLVLPRKGTSELVALSAAVETMALTLDQRAAEREQMAAQVQLQNAALQNLMEAREDSIRALSHDLRTPLAAIHAQAQLLDRSISRAGMDREAHLAAAMVRLTNRFAAMLEDLTDVLRLDANPPAPRLEVVQLAPLMRDVCERVSDPEHVARVQLMVPEDLPQVAGDSGYLERILANLLSNALKYSRPGSPVELHARPDGDAVIVEVRDQGEGMTPQEQEKLFSRYFRTEGAKARHSGLGLGLYITRRLVEAQGGTIQVKSAVGEGSTFQFTVPCAADGADPAQLVGAPLEATRADEC